MPGRKHKLNEIELAELQILNDKIDRYIYELMAACEEINKQKAEIRSGSWWNRMKGNFENYDKIKKNV